MNAKRRREELKTEIAMAKESLGPARVAEREAAAERQAFLNQCSRVEKKKIRMEEAVSSL